MIKTLNPFECRPLAILTTEKISVPMRLYSLVDIQAASAAKFELVQTTLPERNRKSEEKGEVIKRRKIAAAEQRRIATSCSWSCIANRVYSMLQYHK
jgi:hypothetical protein